MRGSWVRSRFLFPCGASLSLALDRLDLKGPLHIVTFRLLDAHGDETARRRTPEACDARRADLLALVDDRVDLAQRCVDRGLTLARVAVLADRVPVDHQELIRCAASEQLDHQGNLYRKVILRSGL